MKTRLQSRQTRLTLLGLTLGILLALLITPQTRWLVRLQALTLLHQYHPLGCASYSASPTGDTRAYDAVAARHPNDLAIQYARATFTEGDPPLRNLRALTRRFPSSPMLYANILREECHRLHKPPADSYKLMNLPVPAYLSRLAAPTLSALAAYDKEAAAGERVDPENAYFPFMRAYGLYAAHRDTEAFAAVKRASTKPLWNEYLMENVEAQWRLHAEAFGDPGALPKSAIWASELLPEYQRLRETARITVYQAVLKEHSGHGEEGYQLREAVRRCGDIMRVQSTTLIGSLVGIAISAVSEARPGGGPYLQTDADTREQSMGEQTAQKRLDAYCVYIAKIGHPEAAQRARDEEAARRTVQGLFKDDPEMLKYVTPLWRLIYWWMGGVALLLNAAWLLVFGLLTFGLRTAGRLRPTVASKSPSSWKAVLLHCLLAVGAWLVLGLLFVCLSGAWITLVYHAPIDWQVTVGVGGVFALVAWLTGYGLRRLPHPRRISVLKTAFLLPVLIGAAYGLYWLVQWAAWPLAEIPQGMMTLMGQENAGTQPSSLWLCTAAALAVPLLLALALTGVALARRVSLPGALTAGFQQLAVPLACLLVIAYGGVLLGTARQEKSVAVLNQHLITDGGRYFAAQVGQAWPGAVR